MKRLLMTQWLLAFRVLLLFLSWLIICVLEQMRMLHESQQEVEKLKEENNALLKLVSSYSVDTLRRLDMLQVSNEKILGDHERLMAKLKWCRHLPSEASRI
ncbi:receptor kinase 3 [Prunus dulcis]|uniref:Receptor kinase 3 n=1 Tax=Prunus dulcis TaxID=3755 RepID=A0A4Y1RSR5_PRUDU|nr:receptor kinase 3 [Prunus dulcis]